jgi:hypothetical protein
LGDFFLAAKINNNTKTMIFDALFAGFNYGVAKGQWAVF